jgi:hypothetical protein
MSTSALSEQSMREYEGKIERVTLGYRREVANKFGSILRDNIKQIEINQPRVEESKFGRKLYSTVKNMMKFNRNVLKTIIVADYRLKILLLTKNEKIIKLHRVKGGLELKTQKCVYELDNYMTKRDAGNRMALGNAYSS